MNIKLQAELRASQTKTDNQYLLAVLYGNKVANVNLKIKQTDFEKTWKQAGESNLIDLELNKETVPVLIKDLQYHPVKHLPIHVDFYQVNMKEKITTEIPLNYIGESKAVKELGGLLMKYADAVEVRCLPGDLLNNLDVDISVLVDFEGAIHMKDLNLPKNMELMRDPEEMVASIIPPKTSEQMAAEEAIEKASQPTATPEATDKTAEETSDKDKPEEAAK